MRNITIETMVTVCHGVLHGEEFVKDASKEAVGVVLDSRLLEENYVFIATKGEKVDGHKFIPSVFEKGALAVLCEDVPEELSGPCIQVKDSFQALKELASFYRQQLDIKVVGVTGSVGKTSTKEFIAGVLSAKYNVWKTQGNFNNEVGLPLTVLQLRGGHEAAVLEMGISDFGEMHRLSEIARPDICVLTNIGQCHLENLGDRDGVLKAKSEIFDFMNPEGQIVVNGDDDKLATLSRTYGQQLTTFGRGKENDIHVAKETSLGLFGTRMDIDGKFAMEGVEVSLPGEHMVLNALAAATVAELLGLSREEIRAGLNLVRAVKGRSYIEQLRDIVLIDDSYNANPVSMKAAMDLLQGAKGRKVAVLGDMFELGAKEEELHYEIGKYAAGKVDYLLCVGSLAEHIYEGALEEKKPDMGLLYLTDKEALYSHLQNILKPGDTLLLKASHGMKFEEIVDWLEKNFS